MSALPSSTASRRRLAGCNPAGWTPRSRSPAAGATHSRRIPTAAALLLLQLLLAPTAIRGEVKATSGQGEALRLDILALYKSNEGQTQHNNPVHLFFELPLTFLGFRVHYHDLCQGVDGICPIGPYRAIVTWFGNDDLPGAQAYRHWLLRQVESGAKLLIFGSFGAVTEPGCVASASDLEETQAIFAALGARYDREAWQLSRSARLIRLAPDLFGFEKDVLVDGVQGFYPLTKEDPNLEPVVELEAPPGSGRRYVAGFLSPRGAFLAQPFTCQGPRSDNKDSKPQFHFDPVRFLARALGCEEEPHADLAVLFGRRMLFAQIDGDGFASPTDLHPGYVCGSRMRDEILTSTALPFTVSFIQGEVDPAYVGTDRLVELAREIARLPNVEVASHGLGHPMDWEKGDLMLTGLPGYSRLDPEKEIFGSLAFLNERILSRERPSKLFLWTGHCNPPEAVLREVRERGLLAINGGNCRVHSDRPSLADLLPPFRHVGREVQVLRRAASDDRFTDPWQGPLDGYRDVLRTFDYGWERYPILPIDLCFPWCSAQNRSSLQALKDVLEWARKQSACPIRVSEYVRIALDFLEVQIAREGKGTWFVRTGGHLRTIRFDGNDRIVDLTKSQGVLGYCRRRGYLYVHLDEGHIHRIRLAPADTQMVFPPFVLESANPIEDWKADASRGSVSFTAWGFGDTDVWLAGLAPRSRYRIHGVEERKVYFADSDSLGRLRVRVPIQGFLSLRLLPSAAVAHPPSYGRLGALMLVVFLLSLYSIALAKRRAKQLQAGEDETWKRRREIRDRWIGRAGSRIRES